MIWELSIILLSLGLSIKITRLLIENHGGLGLYI